MEEFITIEENVQTEITEKKSKFIANLFYVENVEEAEELIKKTKKKYFDAKHNCIAYRVIEKGQIIEKSSDDGEPSGTAGAPLLALLKSLKLTNVIIIVTRYFGGILLGTGGLVRAYTEVAQKAINNARIVQKEYGIKYEIQINYSNLKEIQYICKTLKINIVDIEYKENINLVLESSIKARKELEKENMKILSIKDIESKLIEISKIW